MVEFKSMELWWHECPKMKKLSKKMEEISATPVVSPGGKEVSERQKKQVSQERKD